MKRSKALVIDSSSIRIDGLGIDFGVLAGDFETSVFRADQVDVERIHDPFEPAEPFRSVIDPLKHEFLEGLAQAGRSYDPTPLARLCGYTTSAGRLRLIVQPTEYALFVATNLSLDRTVVVAGGHDVSIRALTSPSPVGLTSPVLANPLNVIAMLVTHDRFTFVPQRGPEVYERPNTRQASVGGAVEFSEWPALGLIRELREEWGLVGEAADLEFLALGVNQHTGEPDLIARIETRLSREQVLDTFRNHNDKFEFREFETVSLRSENLRLLADVLRRYEWSQPSDQAAFLGTLLREFGREKVVDALL
jgi:hypothetical protein